MFNDQIKIIIFSMNMDTLTYEIATNEKCWMIT